eukprot:m.193231 g.193231  ORF g.193231 m.193231 type:complete len:817 (-) comp32497_c0_seq1:57-2507(-)
MFELQRKLFNAKSERLLAVVAVKSVKVARTRRTPKRFLCLTVKDDIVTIQKVKEDKDNTYGERQVWQLTDLRCVDAMSPDPGDKKKETLFTLEFEKTLRWQAASVNERHMFLATLFRVCQRYLKHDGPVFKNFDPKLRHKEEETDDRAHYTQSPMSPLPNDGVEGYTDADDGKALTAQQEDDIDEILAGRDWSQNDAEEYSTSLAQRLDDRENANIENIIGCDKDVEALMVQLDEALETVDKFAACIDEYDHILDRVKKDVMVVAQQNGKVQTKTTNERKLLEEVHTLIDHLHFPRELEAALTTQDLRMISAIDLCIEAVALLEEKRQSKVSEGLKLMAVTRDQTAKLKQLQTTFMDRLSSFMISFLGEQIQDGIQHGTRRRRLEPYAPLMKWLRTAEEVSSLSRFYNFCQTYTDALKPIYEKELKEACERCKHASALKGKTSTVDDIARRQLFNRGLEELLSEVIPIRISEHEFCTSFFLLNEHEKDIHQQMRMRMSSVGSQPSSVLGRLFEGTSDELVALADVAERADPFNTLILLCRFRLAKTELDEHHMLRTSFTQCYNACFAKFGVFIDNFRVFVESAKIPAKKAFGILSICDKFATLVAQMEQVLKTVPGIDRSDIDKQMEVLANTTMASIERIAKECKHQNVVMFENCHHLHRSLRESKVMCLSKFSETARDTYNANMNLYVGSVILGRPLEKLSAFFDSVDRLIQSGTNPKDVNFQNAFSKTELTKVIQQYPGKEVKKNLDAMYKRVSRHLCVEERLLDVVWVNIQHEFVGQYRRFQDLIDKCYPGASILFNVDDLLTYFSSIKNSHS